MEAFPDSIDCILRSGHLLGAHGFSHKKTSQLSSAQFKDDVSLLGRLIEAAYIRNGVKPRRYFRFPYFDKGSDSFPCDPAEMTEQQTKRIKDIMLDLRLEVDPPSPEQLMHKRKCQNILKREGYAPCGIRDDIWDSVEELKSDCDIGASIITADWKLLPRHRERYGMTVEKLCAILERKLQGRGTAIVLTHDYDDYGEAFSDFCKIIMFLQLRVDFLRLPGSSLPLPQNLTVAG